MLASPRASRNGALSANHPVGSHDVDSCRAAEGAEVARRVVAVDGLRQTAELADLGQAAVGADLPGRDLAGARQHVVEESAVRADTEVERGAALAVRRLLGGACDLVQQRQAAVRTDLPAGDRAGGVVGAEGVTTVVHDPAGVDLVVALRLADRRDPSVALDAVGARGPGGGPVLGAAPADLREGGVAAG